MKAPGVVRNWGARKCLTAFGVTPQQTALIRGFGSEHFKGKMKQMGGETRDVPYQTWPFKGPVTAFSPPIRPPDLEELLSIIASGNQFVAGKSAILR